MTAPSISYLDENGNLSSDYKGSISTEILVKAYKAMIQTRLIDERMITLQRQGLITFALSSFGEEACAVASAAALTLDDWMYPQYREAGIMFWRGFTTQKYIHHMFGNKEDLTLGRQMPNHFGSRELNVVTVSSPIGTKIPHAAGCAYAMKLQKEKNVAIAYFGDGATSEGDFYVGLNFAAVRKAPAIFFCRNNGYAISTPCCKQFITDGVILKGIAAGIQTFRVDGNDFFAIYDTVSKAREYCIAGNGPVFIEAMTYRLGAHSTSDDPSIYRPENEDSPWMLKCPILRLKKYLISKNAWDINQEDALQKEYAKQIDEAIAVAKQTSKPALQSIIEDVYFEPTENLREQLEELRTFFPSEK